MRFIDVDMIEAHFNSLSTTTPPSGWSRHQNKLFEVALTIFPEESPARWEMMAAQIPGKSAVDVRKYYEDLEHDLMEIESGRVELPSYDDGELESSPSWVNELGGSSQVWFGSKGKEKERECERRKGVPWTEDEHRLFLMGLQKYGKGDWRSISRHAVVSRTPTQVASHAQKYFVRLDSSMNKKVRKRSSIYDIALTADDNSMDQIQNQSNSHSHSQSQTEFMDQSKFFNEQGKPYGNSHDFNFPLYSD